MEISGRKRHLNLSPLRRRKQAANNRRFCIIWINRMVKKQVEKQIADLSSEFYLMNEALREEMTELQEQLRELEAREAEQTSLYFSKLDREPRMTLWWQRKMEEYRKNAKEDGKHEATLLNHETLSFNFPESPSDTNNIKMRKPQKRALEHNSKSLLNLSDSSDCEASDVSNDADTNCKQEENQRASSYAATLAHTSQMMKESEEEESSRNRFHESPSFVTPDLRCKAGRVQVDRPKDTQALLMERQWKEWMDKQEKTENLNEVKQVDQRKTEKHGAAASPAPKKPIKQNVKGVDTMMKMKTYFSDLVHSHGSYKWERLEDDD